MSIWDKDASFDDSTPFEILIVDLVNKTLRYTTYPQDITINNFIYKAIPLKHENPEYEIFKDDAQITLSVPYTEELSDYFINGVPIGLVNVELRYCNLFVTDPSDVVLTTNDYITVWRGLINSFNCELPWFELTTTNIFSSTARVGIRRRYSRTCPYPLYGNLCKIPKSEFVLNTTVDNYSGNTIGPAVILTENLYKGGYCTYINEDTGFTANQFIVSNSATQLVLSSLVRKPVIGGLLQIYQGCNHTIEDCIARYDNRPNCGAFPHVPVKKLFGASSSTYY
jgi:hypothetical protein